MIVHFLLALFGILVMLGGLMRVVDWWRRT